MNDRFVIGVAFGTESVRSLFVAASNGSIIAKSEYRYKDGVINGNLPGYHRPLPLGYALQNPDDRFIGLKQTKCDVIDKL